MPQRGFDFGELEELDAQSLPLGKGSIFDHDINKEAYNIAKTKFVSNHKGTTLLEPFLILGVLPLCYITYNACKIYFEHYAFTNHKRSKTYLFDDREKSKELNFQTLLIEFLLLIIPIILAVNSEYCPNILLFIYCFNFVILFVIWILTIKNQSENGKQAPLFDILMQNAIPHGYVKSKKQFVSVESLFFCLCFCFLVL